VSNYVNIGNVFLILATVPAVISVVVYAKVTWWRSRWGIHLMAYMFVMAELLGLGCIRLVWGDQAWFEVLRAAAYVQFVIVLWWRMFYVIQAANEGSPDESLKENREH
jgi:hypothetical protein